MSNIFEIHTPIIIWTLWKKYKPPCTLKGRIILYWPFTRIMTRNMLIFPCQITWTNPSNISTPWPQKATLCTPQMNSASIWPNQSTWKSTRQHSTSWCKRHQRYTSQSCFVTLILVSSWSNHVTCFKRDKWYQRKPNLHTNCATDMMINYDHTYPNGNMHYQVSYMIPHIESDDVNLVIPGACSRLAGYYYLSDHPTKCTNTSDVNPNGRILT